MNFKKVGFIFFSLLVLFPLIFAIPQVPHAFYGNFVIDGNAGAIGCMICTEINDVTIASDCITTISSGIYGDNRMLIAQGATNGDIIKFKIGNIYAEENYTFLSGAVTNLDLNFIGANCSISSCGNNFVDGSDQCDGIDLDNQTCSSQGFLSGTLSCNSDCTFNTSSCVTSTNTNGGSSSNGSSGSSSSSGSSLIVDQDIDVSDSNVIEKPQSNLPGDLENNNSIDSLENNDVNQNITDVNSNSNIVEIQNDLNSTNNDSNKSLTWIIISLIILILIGIIYFLFFRK